MKKRLTLTAGIMNIISGVPILLLACYIFISGLTAVEPLVLIPGLGIFGVFYFIISILIVCVGCAAITFGVCEIGYACKGDLHYSGKKNQFDSSYCIFFNYHDCLFDCRSSDVWE